MKIPMPSATQKLAHVSKTMKISIQNNFIFFGVSRKTVLGNVVRKLHAKIDRASFIRKCFKTRGTKTPTKKQKIIFLERF